MMKQLSITLACLTALLPIEAAFGQISYRSDVVNWSASSNGGAWGSWTGYQYCPGGSWASGFKQRVEYPQGSGDDTALNSIALICTDRYGNRVGNDVTPHEGYWGSWATNQCSTGSHMTYFRLKVEGQQGSGDDTAANAVSFWCSNNVELSASNAGAWGNWGSWIGGYSNAAICGLAEKIESPQGSGDDTALNNVSIVWCSR